MTDKADGILMPEKDDMARFSDTQLLDLCEDFEQHKNDFEQHKKEQDERWIQLGTMVEKNTQATERLAESVEQIAKSTEGVVQLYNDFRGAGRLGLGVQKFLAWVAALGTAGAAIAAAITYVLTKIGP